MTSVDLYEYDGTIATPPNERAQPGDGAAPQNSPTLNEEVTQVVGQLKSFWGGFRKQSATALENARKDFGSVVSQAQKELGKLTEPTSAASAVASTHDSSTGEVRSEETEDVTKVASTSALASEPTLATSVSQRANLLLSRLQSTLPPNLSESFQKRLHDAQDNPALNQVRSSITSGLSRLQEQTKGMSLAQAEEFIQQRSEVLLKEAGDFFKDAVKVVPPEENAASTSTTIWDGSDSWMISTSTTPEPSTRDKGSDSLTSEAKSVKRSDALLHRLRTDRAIMLLDPTSDPSRSTQDILRKWTVSTADEVLSDAWKEKRETALKAEDDALDRMHTELVPAHLNEVQFWRRYFFRVHEIEADEERRRTLLEGVATQGAEEDFDWEDDEDETKSTTTTQIQRRDSTTPTGAAAGEHRPTSPRESEDSYDVVSQASGIMSRTSPGSSEGKGANERRQPNDNSGKLEDAADEGDSDWE